MSVALRRIGTAALIAVSILTACVAWLAFTEGTLTFWNLSGPIPALDLRCGVARLGGVFCALLAVLDAAIALWSQRRGRAADGVLLAGFSAAMLLVLCAQSVALFFFAWELCAIVSVFLVAAHHERREVRRAAFVYLIFSQTGAACILVALALLERHANSPAFSDIAAAAGSLPDATRYAVLGLSLAGFGSKAGLLPLHFWLPRAHPVAPAHASALLSGGMLQIALYAMTLVTLILAAPAGAVAGYVLLGVGTLTAAGGVLYALVDRDLKRLLAYSSVENAGIVTLALGASLVLSANGNRPGAALASAAALFHAFNHGLFKALLFLGAGSVADSQGTVDLERLGGLWKRMPWTGTAMLAGCAAAAGMPPLNGFASEWLTFQGLLGLFALHDPAPKFAALAALSGLALAGGLAAATFVKVFGIAFLGRPRGAPRVPAALERYDAANAALFLLAAVCVVLGLFPALAFAPIVAVSAALAGSLPVVPPALPLLPFALVALPLLGAVYSFTSSTAARSRSVAPWTCGSPVTRASQYTATAFSKPLRRIFSAVLAPAQTRTFGRGESPWFPKHIEYRTESRYLIDEAARRLGALTIRAARRSRVVQSGSLRLYLAYALVAMVVAVGAAAR